MPTLVAPLPTVGTEGKQPRMALGGTPASRKEGPENTTGTGGGGSGSAILDQARVFGGLGAVLTGDAPRECTGWDEGSGWGAEVGPVISFFFFFSPLA